ncbi:hypothetical protein Y88_1892 [Novosphingobium nitrogenifigens DSM 19370]|uniref:Uncharacterized protein n=1 Tax=Novosphingobium nitrogenifigens DSM 19370 TaxID=983920 RepID=F1Z553_9SPHN|nr:hypothetical protein [Novosphingobium nitrogenifigens]EGD60018.1 hypothetical protein Y88_1892 [Novosphingobium nitrogenifigens DSM 19370]
MNENEDNRPETWGLETKQRKRKRILKSIPGYLWITIALAWFAYESAHYIGLFAKLSEWEFGTFGISWPMLTFCVLAGAFGIPGMLLIAAASREARRDEEKATIEASLAASAAAEEGEEETPVHPDIQRAERTARLLSRVTRLAAMGAIACLIPILFLPGMQDHPRAINADAPGTEISGEGPAQLTGTVLLSRTATLEHSFFGFRRAMHIAPVLPPAGQDTIHVFVEITQDDLGVARERGTRLAVTGTLVRQGMPGALRVLYHNAGIDLAEEGYVLYRYRGSMLRPYIGGSVQCALIGLATLLLWLWQRRHLRALVREEEKNVLELDPGMDLPA